MKNKHNNLIFTCGFGWSGSGALIDFMLDFEKVEKFPGGETFLLKSLINILQKIEARKPLDVENGYHERIFLGDIPKKIDTQVRDRIKRVLDDFISQSSINIEEYRAIAGKILTILMQKNSNAVLVNCVTEYLIYLNNIKEKNSIIIFDNAIGAVDINLFQYVDVSQFENIFIYIVDRNPKDRFIELYDIVLKGYKSRSFCLVNKIFRFIKNFRGLTRFIAAVYFTHYYNNKRKQKYKKNLKLLVNHNDSITLREFMFEDVVLNHMKIKKILESDLNRVLATKYTGVNYFNPEVSKKNIHKYAEIENSLAIKYIEKFAK